MSFIDKVDNWEVTSIRQNSLTPSDKPHKQSKQSKSKKSTTNTNNFKPTSSSHFHFQNLQVPPELELSNTNISYQSNCEKQQINNDMNNVEENSSTQKPNLNSFKPSPPPVSKCEKFRQSNPCIVPIEASVGPAPIAVQPRYEPSESPGWAKQKYKKCVEKVTENPCRITKDCCSQWMKQWWWVALLLLLSIIGIIIGSILAFVPLHSN
ncbi:hypothetical protein Ahia01_000312300 [Argonauta hians]